MQYAFCIKYTLPSLDCRFCLRVSGNRVDVFVENPSKQNHKIFMSDRSTEFMFRSPKGETDNGIAVELSKRSVELSTHVKYASSSPNRAQHGEADSHGAGKLTKTRLRIFFTCISPCHVLNSLKTGPSIASLTLVFTMMQPFSCIFAIILHQRCTLLLHTTV